MEYPEYGWISNPGCGGSELARRRSLLGFFTFLILVDCRINFGKLCLRPVLADVICFISEIDGTELIREVRP